MPGEGTSLPALCSSSCGRLFFHFMSWLPGSKGQPSEFFFLPAAAGAFLLLAGCFILPSQLVTNNEVMIMTHPYTRESKLMVARNNQRSAIMIPLALFVSISCLPKLEFTHTLQEEGAQNMAMTRWNRRHQPAGWAPFALSEPSGGGSRDFQDPWRG